jgi:magnesium transporter
MKTDYNKPLREFISPVRTTIHIDQTIEEALSFLREKHIDEEIIYIYVVDDKRKLLGVVPTRRLLLSEPDSPIISVMDTSLVRLNCNQTLQEAMEYLESHRLLALPVVDDKDHLLGVIHVGHYLEEKFDVANSRRRTDIFQLIGMVVEEGKKAGAWAGYRSRMPWIFCNMFGGFACAVISRVFEVVLAKVLILAMFIPLLLTLSESISMQSMTQSMQLLKRPTRKMRYIFQCLIREWQTVSMLAVSSGLLVGIVSLFWGDGLLPALTISFGIMVSVVITASIGSVIPLILHAQKWDPRVAAGPVVLMFADVLTTLFYLALGTWWLV